MANRMLLPTTVVGSYPQPDWLINRKSLGKQVPRVRAPELWRISGEWLEQAQDDATIVAIHEMESAGIDIITDGEMRRESYSNRFATSLEGIDPDRAGKGAGRLGSTSFPVPLVTGPIRRRGPVEVRDLKFLGAHTKRQIKITLPGPFTMAHQNDNQFYPDREKLAMDLAVAVNKEIRDLFAAGADVVQIDEPWMEARAQQAKEYGVKVVNRARRRPRNDCSPRVLRLRACDACEAVGVFLLERTRRQHRAADINRDRAAKNRSCGAERSSLQDHHSWRDRSGRSER